MSGLKTTLLSEFALRRDAAVTAEPSPDDGPLVAAGRGEARGELAGELEWSLYERQGDEHCSMTLRGTLNNPGGSRPFEARGIAKRLDENGSWRVAGSLRLEGYDDLLLWRGDFSERSEQSRWAVFDARGGSR